MNKNQKKVIMAGLVVIVLMGLFPPWVHTVNVRTVTIERAGNYGFMFSPPPPGPNLPFLNENIWGVRLDVSRLLIQWILVVIVCGLVVFLNKDNVREA